MIVGADEGVVEKKNGFFGCSHNEDVLCANALVEGRERFAEPGCTGSLGVAAPVLEESVVGEGLKSEEIGDSAGFCV